MMFSAAHGSKVCPLLRRSIQVLSPPGNFATLRALGTASPLTETRVSETRGQYASLKDADVRTFENLLGSDCVLTDPSDVEPFNCDWLKTCRGSSSLVLLPRTTEEVSAILQYCNEHNLAVCPQGGNTGLVGGSVPVFDEVLLSTKKMNKIGSLDSLSGAVTCQAGCILETLDDYVGNEGYVVPLDLGAKGSCHIGGNVSTNAGGLRLLRYGSLHGTVLGLEAVLANGKIINCLQRLRKDNTGYDLKQLFIGSEGTLGVVTQVALQCAPRPATSCVAFLGCQTFNGVLQTFRAAKGMMPEFLSSFEFMDSESIRCLVENRGFTIPVKEHPFYLLIEVSGSEEDTLEDSLLKFVERVMKEDWVLDGTMAKEPSRVKDLWRIRETIPESLLHDGYIYKYDVSVPLKCYGDAVGLIRSRVGDRAVRVCSFGHMGDSNLHLNVTSRTFSAEILAQIEPFIYSWTSSLQGSISAEHGIGLLKRKYLQYSKTPAAIETMRLLKQSMDPKGILNPYKVIP
ncbi:D-2-hydroxyglutarate dehydrogenase, mitochondrial-like [Ornithodoros turicata]|uniref:D-2-hydroxyglutarate dehydrogenase, mitochondrial-like n=1 Tax=Ornithodoros turicata TaxID=34597 RepID=UPI00313A4D02